METVERHHQPPLLNDTGILLLLNNWTMLAAGGSNAPASNGTLAGAANDSTEATAAAVGFVPRFGLLRIVLTSILLGAMILCTIVGNVFVVAAIILERNLLSVSNYLILSLAVADLMVATLVMPICALKEMSKVWWLGVHLCDLWTCLDVLCCTASILHLVGIAMDRYWAVTNVNYIRARTGRRIGLMIAGVWVTSAAISVPARFWYMEKKPGDCRINESPEYTVFSTVGAFYLPMIFIIGIYLLIYRAARKRIRRKAFKPPPRPPSVPSAKKKQPPATAQTPSKTASAAAAVAAANQDGKTPADRGGGGSSGGSDASSGTYQTTSFGTTTAAASTATAHQQQQQQQQQQPQQPQSRQNGRAESAAEAKEMLTVQSKAAMQRERLEQKRERKAARTLAIITGCFLVCWLPFFIRAVVCPFYTPLCTHVISETGHSLIQWLGYTNSLLNPVIYTIFSPDFRSAFSKILFGRYRRR